MKVVTVVGARPQFPKAAMLSRALRPRHEEVLVHTGQHYDDLMSDVFFRELDLPEPDFNLGVGSGSHGVQTARMLEGIEVILEEQRPGLVIVFGDTNSTLAGALAAAKLNIPLAHVEAGLRSYDRSMPEEVNRVVADHVSTYLFCPTRNAVDCLALEGITRRVYQVGDLMFDALQATLPRETLTPSLSLAGRGGQEVRASGYLEMAPGSYYLATVHRQSNTNDPVNLRSIFGALGALDLPVVLPVHPRTKAALDAYGIATSGSVRLCDPVGYVEMLSLEQSARAILTDSGGVQREAYFLGVPCVTLREESEWPETLEDGWNVLAGADGPRIIEAATRPKPAAPPLPLFGDGHAAEKIVEILERDPP